MEGSSPIDPDVLDQRYPGWRVADIGLDGRTTVKPRLGPEPNVISGDFDGNGWPDDALLIEHRNTDPREFIQYFNEVVAFINHEYRFPPDQLRDRQPGPNPGLYLTLQKKGAEGLDFEARRNSRTRPIQSANGSWAKAVGAISFAMDAFGSSSKRIYLLSCSFLVVSCQLRVVSC